MIRRIKPALQRLIFRLGLDRLTIRAPRGFVRGARWTLYPWTSYWRGTHEPAVARALESLGSLVGKVCWDLGAHYGYYSIGMALRTGPQGRVVAVEPLPSNYERLCLHARINQLHWLTPLAAAASEKPGEADMLIYPSSADTQAHLPYHEAEDSAAVARRQRVKLVCLDDEVQAGRIPPPDLIKIDVEGHGHMAIAGALSTIRRARPTIVMAFHGDTELMPTRAMLEPLGYGFSPILPGDLGGGVGDCLLQSKA